MTRLATLFAPLAALVLVGAAGGQELTAHPSEPVFAAPLADPVEAGAALAALRAPTPAALPDPTPDLSGRDPLHELISSASTLSVADADALLHEAYDVYPTATTRSRAFGAAATAASAAGRHELALAWTDWAIREADQAPERDLLLADRLAEGVGVALAAGNPVLARAYVRRAAAHAPGGRDDADARAVVFDRVALACPDVIADAYLRIGAAATRSEPGLLGAPAADCAYIPILGPREAGFRLQAVRSFIGLEERAREVTERGLDAREVDARSAVERRLTTMTTALEPIFLEGGEGLVGYVRYDRPGVDDVAAYAYAAAAQDGVFYAGSASARDWAWPPDELGRRAAIGLEAALATKP